MKGKISFFLPVMIIIAGLLVFAAQKAQSATNPPVPIWPSKQIVSNKPVLHWSSISRARAYRVEIYRGRKLIYRKNCTATRVTVYDGCDLLCSKRLARGNYYWRVRGFARPGGWSKWSRNMRFTVVNSSTRAFSYNFKKHAWGWKPQSGRWGISKKRGYYFAQYYGVVIATGVHSLHELTWRNFYYQVRMRTTRLGTSTRLGIVARFQEDRRKRRFGRFVMMVRPANQSVLTYGNGGGAYTLPDSFISKHVRKTGWNILGIRCRGGKIQFFVNNKLVKTLYWRKRARDYFNLAKGQVGILCYLNGRRDYLFVDWAKLRTY